MEYLGASEFLVWIQRKPHPSGFKIFLWCFTLSTGRPVAHHLINDLRHPAHGQAEVMDKFVALAPPDMSISITADSWFSSLQWMESREGTFTMSISTNKLASEIGIFASDLGLHEYRVIQRGDLMLSFWQDGNLLICATNAYKKVNVGGASSAVVGSNTDQIKCSLSREDFEKLQELSTQGLSTISKRCGQSGSERPPFFFLEIFSYSTKIFRWNKIGTCTPNSWPPTSFTYPPDSIRYPLWSRNCEK